MDEHALPYDVMWLDIDHTDGSRFFTWNLRAFTHPSELLGALLSTGRRLVTVVDPMVKVDPAWRLYRDARDRDLFIKNKDRVDFTGARLFARLSCFIH